MNYNHLMVEYQPYFLSFGVGFGSGFSIHLIEEEAAAPPGIFEFEEGFVERGKILGGEGEEAL